MKIIKTSLFFGSLFIAMVLVYNPAAAQRNIRDIQSSVSGTHPTDFRKGYLRLGISSQLNSELNNSSSPDLNVSEGQLGSTLGYSFELGRKFYFNNSSAMPLRYGLDWTIISLTYNELNWNEYSEAQGNMEAQLFPALSLASKLGPVVSFNPIEELILDARVQFAVSMSAIGLDYYDDNTDDYYTFLTSGSESFIESISELGFHPSFGFTVRRKGIGLSVDYFTQKVVYDYSSYNTDGTVEFPINTIQLKLNFSY